MKYTMKLEWKRQTPETVNRKATHAVETTSKGGKRRENNLKATHAMKTTYKRHTL